MNKDIALEIAQNDELGYKIAPNQMEMTPKQKIFLPKAHILLEQIREENSNKNQNTGSTGISTPISNRLKRRVKEKQKLKGVSNGS